MKRLTRRAVLGGAAAMGVALGARRATAAPVRLNFYFPVAVGGPITKIIDGMVADFEKEHADVTVNAIYSGSYQDTTAKALTAVKSGEPPHLAVALSTDMFTFIDEDAIVPFDEIAGSGGKTWLDGFFPAFMANSRAEGRVWGVPFQRSTIVLYWNKTAFRAAGLDPDKAPATWDEMRGFAGKLTRRSGADVAQWGVEIPSSGFPYWLFQGLTTENGAILMNEAGNEVYFDKPEVVEALQYMVDLGRKWQVMPQGIIEWGTTPQDFFERKTAMMWTTTGNLTNVRANAPFPFGVAMLPAQKRRGSPTGGGNFYLFKKTSPAERQAALAFVQWMTTPERAAEWGIKTGYVAVRPDAWTTPAMKRYVANFPAAAVARDQLEFAVAEFSTHDNQRVTKILNDGLQAALTGEKHPAQALADAQSEADRVLRPYRRS